MCFFFFKQKTAYEMRISDWSSDVCSSDLLLAVVVPEQSAAEDHGRREIAVRSGDLDGRILLAGELHCLDVVLQRGHSHHREGTGVEPILGLVGVSHCPGHPTIDRKSTRLNSSH